MPLFQSPNATNLKFQGPSYWARKLLKISNCSKSLAVLLLLAGPSLFGQSSKESVAAHSTPETNANSFSSMNLDSSASQARSSRIEELFVWKISEELKLSVKEEKDLSNLIYELNRQKMQANDDIDEIVKKLSEVDSEKNQRQLLREYRAALGKYNKISTDEVDRIQKLLTPGNSAKYFVVKAELSKKIRNLLSSQDHLHTRGGRKLAIKNPVLGIQKLLKNSLGLCVKITHFIISVVD